MNILVTGGCGYVGSVLTPKLLEQGHKVTVYDTMWFGNFLEENRNLTIIEGDIRNIDAVPMSGMDAIIHLANIANDPCGDLSAKLSWEVNVLATMGLVEKAIAHGVRQFMLSSSGSVYGVKDEPQVTEDLSLVPISDYNKTKMISERVLLGYRDRIIIQIVRPATICGYSPRMRLDLSVNMLTMQALANGRITVFGGNQTRPNIHIQDITDVFIYLLDLGDRATGIYNAGFENISILEMAQMVTESIPAEIIVSESNDPRSYRLNSDKLVKTGYKPKFKILDAIREIREAFRAGRLRDSDQSYNIRTMLQLENLNRGY